MVELFGIKVKKQILSIAQKYHYSKNFTRDDYVIKCMRVVARSIKDYYTYDFQYFDLFMLEYGKFTNISNIDFELLKEFSNEKLIPVIEFSKLKIQEGKVLSFVKLMNRKIKNGIVLYENGDFNVNEFEEKTDSFCFNLKPTFQFSSSIDTLSNELLTELINTPFADDEIVSNLLNHLQVNENERSEYERSIKIQKLYPRTVPGINAYFIRPRIANTNFNGVFYLQLTTPLSYQHFNEITEIITQIYCEIALWRSRSHLSKKINHNISDEHSHFLKHEFDALAKLADDIQTKSDDDEDVIALKQKLNHISRLNDFHLFMTRAVNMDTKAMTEDAVTHNFSEINAISFRITFKDVLGTIAKSIAQFNIPKENIEVYRNVIGTLTNQITAFPKFHLKVLKEGLYLLLLEILKNAFEHANRESPIIKVEWGIYSENRFFLKIISNSYISDDEIKNINEGNINVIAGKRHKIGLRTVFKIINFKNLNSSEKLWRIQAKCYKSKHSQEYFTNITFLIPKEDVII